MGSYSIVFMKTQDLVFFVMQDFSNAEVHFPGCLWLLRPSIAPTLGLYSDDTLGLFKWYVSVSNPLITHLSVLSFTAIASHYVGTISVHVNHSHSAGASPHSRLITASTQINFL